MADVGHCEFKQESQSKASEQYQTLLKIPWPEMPKEGMGTLKTCKAANEYYSTYNPCCNP